MIKNKQKIEIYAPNKSDHLAIQDLLLNSGIKHFSYPKKRYMDTDFRYIVVFHTENQYGGNSFQRYDGVPFFSLPMDWSKLIKHLYSPLMVGEHTVEFKENGVQIGCQFVDKETVFKIAEGFKNGSI